MAKQAKNNGAKLGFESQIWAAADKLRGNMEPSDYKHVALGLIFLRRGSRDEARGIHCPYPCRNSPGRLDLRTTNFVRNERCGGQRAWRRTVPGLAPRSRLILRHPGKEDGRQVVPARSVSRGFLLLRLTSSET